MITNLFTTLCDLVDAEDERLLQIFEKYQSRETWGESGSSSGSMMSCMITAPTHVTEQTAYERMLTALHIVRCNRNNQNKVIVELSKILSAEGIGHLMTELVYRTTETDEELVNNLLSGVEIFSSLVSSHPLFKIEVEEDTDPGAFETPGGKYNIYFHHLSTHKRYPINFKLKDSKILFLWFLLQPREELKKKSIQSKHKELVDLCVKCFDSYLDHYIKMEEKMKNDFDSFMTSGISNCRNNIIKALEEMDIPEWYVVDYDKGSGSYSLSLPDYYISLPDSLKQFKRGLVR